MTIKVTCRCGQSFAAHPGYAGRTVPCPACRQPLTVLQADAFDLEPLAPPAPTVSKSLPPAPVQASSGGRNLTLLLAIGGGAAIFLLVTCGVLGAVVYSGYSNARDVATRTIENSDFGGLQVPLDELQKQAAESSKEMQKLLGQPGEAPVSNKGPASTDPASLLLLAKMSPHVVPGAFSIAASPELVWEDFPKNFDSLTPTQTSYAKKPGPTITDTLIVQLTDTPNAPQRHRLVHVQLQKAYLVPFSSLHPVRALKGLDITEDIPDVVSYTYEFQVGDDYGRGAGKIIFGSKRISVMSGRVFDPKDFRALEVSLASFVEL